MSFDLWYGTKAVSNLWLNSVAVINLRDKGCMLQQQCRDFQLYCNNNTDQYQFPVPRSALFFSDALFFFCDLESVIKIYLKCFLSSSRHY